jgi:phosphoribosylcarboxyaminoimidazole (NCAIR) mutase
MQALVGIMMGSASDLPLMKEAAAILESFEVPVATVALNGAMNAGILAVQIIATGDPALMKKVIAYKEKLREKIYKSSEEVNKLDFKFQVKPALV